MSTLSKCWSKLVNTLTNLVLTVEYILYVICPQCSKCWSKLVSTLTNLVLIHIICYLSTVFQMLIRTCSHPPVIETEDMSESGQAEEPGKKVTYRDFMELWDTLFNSPRIKVRKSIVYQHKVKWFWFFADLCWLWLSSLYWKSDKN